MKLSCLYELLQNLLEDEANKGSKQRPGFKSAMLADVRPSADGRVRYLFCVNYGLLCSSLLYLILPDIHFGYSW